MAADPNADTAEMNTAMANNVSSEPIRRLPSRKRCRSAEEATDKDKDGSGIHAASKHKDNHSHSCEPALLIKPDLIAKIVENGSVAPRPGNLFCKNNTDDNPCEILPAGTFSASFRR